MRSVNLCSKGSGNEFCMCCVDSWHVIERCAQKVCCYLKYISTFPQWAVDVGVLTLVIVLDRCLVLIRSMMNPSRSTVCLIKILHVLWTGPAMRILRTPTTCTTCLPTWPCWTTWDGEKWNSCSVFIIVIVSSHCNIRLSSRKACQCQNRRLVILWVTSLCTWLQRITLFWYEIHDIKLHSTKFY